MIPLRKRLPALLATGLGLAWATALPAAPMFVYFGTYTQTTSRGIYVARFDPATGALATPELAGEGRNPTFIAFAPGQNRLYAVGEMPMDPPPTPPVGCVSAFDVDPATGKLAFINRQPAGQGGTTHVAVDATGRMAVTVSYSGAYVAAFPIAPDGRLGEKAAYVAQKGPLGPNKDRQKQAHAHSVTLSPDNRFAFVCDLGTDQIFSYRIDPATAGLVPNDPPTASAPPGVGPRHSKFSADAKFFYVVDEMGGSVCAYAYDAARGALSLIQTISILPPDFKGLNTSAEIRIHPNGRFVYASNRGDDSIAVLARDPATGRLSLLEIVPCGGKHPRNFALTADGRWLLCANRDTDNVAVFSVDARTGRLTPAGRPVSVPMPVCVLIRD